MPWTRHECSFKRSLPEWAAVMRADPRHCANIACYVAEYIEVRPLYDLEERALGQFVEGRQFSVRHPVLIFQCTLYCALFPKYRQCVQETTNAKIGK